MKSHIETSIRLLPDLGYLKTYDRSLWRADPQAGITVAIFAVPQVMAYAMLAGLAPIYGLYSGVVAAFIGGPWGWSPFISTGPSNSAALLTAAAIAPFVGQGDPMSAVFAFGLLVGVLRLAIGLLQGGRLAKYVPLPILPGPSPHRRWTPDPICTGQLKRTTIHTLLQLIDHLQLEGFTVAIYPLCHLILS